MQNHFMNIKCWNLFHFIFTLNSIHLVKFEIRCMCACALWICVYKSARSLFSELCWHDQLHKLSTLEIYLYLFLKIHCNHFTAFESKNSLPKVLNIAIQFEPRIHFIFPFSFTLCFWLCLFVLTAKYPFNY